jgi:disulfide bond formation protein DsbB
MTTPTTAKATPATARNANLLGFCACAAALGYAYYCQYVLHLEPCPLCMFQRVGVFVTGLLFLVAAAHDPIDWGRRVYGLLLGVAALATAGVALRHLWVQSQPPGTVASCGATLDFMLKVFPLREVLVKVLSGSGECAKVDWRFLGLAMPAWVLLFAVAVGGFGLWANLRHRPPVLQF